MYQTMSPENVPSSSLRKSNHFKTRKLEDQNSPESRTIIITQEQHHQTLNSSTQSRDVLLQWGQRKRSRCSRTESRSIPNSNSNSNSSEKHHIIPMSTSLPHPSSLPSTSRVRPNNGFLHSKDTNAFPTSKNRSIAADEMGCTNGTSPSRNGSRTIGRSSITKRSPSRKVKSDDSLGNGNHHHHHHHHHHHRDHGQIESTAEVEINNNGGHNNEGDKGEVVEWPRIYISLSRKEKEDDFYAMKGTKLPHRPKKRPKAVDRALQYCFPGLWLSDLTRARYEVRERKSAKKPKRRGLKGLENMESESE